jgi:hypothetical protein
MSAATGTMAAGRPELAPGAGATRDHRGSWMPSGRMIAARFHELRTRRGLMLLLIGVTVVVPTGYLILRLLLHAVAPHTYGPAGGYDVYVGAVTGVLYVFGFIVAATLGATAGSVDLTEGMFRHHVITGRSRLSLYLARIPAGLGIILPLIAVGFTVVCAVCCFAAPRQLSYSGASMPAQLSRTGLVQWAEEHPHQVVDNFPIIRIDPSVLSNMACFPGPPGTGKIVQVPGGPTSSGPCTPSELRAFAVTIANHAYDDYSRQFVSPTVSLMIKSGLWIELEATVAFLVALGLSSLIGQRTVSMVLMIVLELIVTPIALRAHIPHLVNLQRTVIGAATSHLEPGRLPAPFGGGSVSDQAMSLHESSVVAVCVIVAWVVAWTALGAWRMVKRDA